MLLGLFLSAAAMTPTAGPLPAAGNVSAANVQSVANALQRAGYKALVKVEDDTGDPYIESGSGGSEFRVFFYGCTKGANCATVQFYSGYENHKADLAKINSWNADNRFGRAYLTDKGMARIEMDLDLDDGGMSPALFEDNIEFWVAVMAKFQDFIY